MSYTDNGSALRGDSTLSIPTRSAATNKDVSQNDSRDTFGGSSSKYEEDNWGRSRPRAPHADSSASANSVSVDKEGNMRPLGGSLSRSSTFGISTGADSLAYCHQQGQGQSHQSQRSSDDNENENPDDDNTEDALYGASAGRGSAGGGSTTTPQERPGLSASDSSSESSYYDTSTGLEPEPAPPSRHGSEEDITLGAGKGKTARSSSSSGRPTAAAAAASAEENPASATVTGGHGHGQDSKLGKFLQKTGKALHSDKLAEKGRQKREGARQDND